MSYKLLIADDEKDIVNLLCEYFEYSGYTVVKAFSGEQALELLPVSPDLILLDINMPGLDGVEVCRKIRDHISCPILFLTARIEEADRILGFSAGGDDYILKPFQIGELGARVAAHLRRERRGHEHSNVRFWGELAIDYGSRRILSGSEAIPLTKKEFDIVALLSLYSGQVFDRERIYEKVWGYDAEGDSGVVAEHIRRIRQKLSVHTDREVIRTVWGGGYQWKK